MELVAKQSKEVMNKINIGSSFLLARAFSLAREARRQFRSKKVRISSNKRTINN